MPTTEEPVAQQPASATTNQPTNQSSSSTAKASPPDYDRSIEEEIEEERG